jgi:hypothetical protein
LSTLKSTANRGHVGHVTAIGAAARLKVATVSTCSTTTPSSIPITLTPTGATTFAAGAEVTCILRIPHWGCALQPEKWVITAADGSIKDVAPTRIRRSPPGENSFGKQEGEIRYNDVKRKN